jgi:hypothetical protein
VYRAVVVGKHLKQQFSRIGGDTSAKAEEDAEDSDEAVFHHNFVLVKENQHTFTLKATGRVNCVGLQATLNVSNSQVFVVVLSN